MHAAAFAGHLISALLPCPHAAYFLFKACLSSVHQSVASVVKPIFAIFPSKTPIFHLTTSFSPNRNDFVRLRIESHSVRVDAYSIRVDACSVRVDTYSVRVDAYSVRVDAFSESFTKLCWSLFSQLLLHFSYTVFELFGGKVFPHTVHFNGETEGC